MLATFAYLCITNRHNGEQPQARVAQLVERDLAKVEVASSNLVSRSKNKKDVAYLQRLFCFPMAAPRRFLSTDEDFRRAVATSLSVRQVLGYIGLVPAGGNYKTVQARIQQLALDTSHFTGAGWNVGARYKAFGRKATLEEILVENSAYTFTHGLRGRLLKEGWKQPQCEQCGLTEWCGQPISLELHHGNGINNDHRIANLHLLCPNCHAQTKNYRGKNQQKC